MRAATRFSPARNTPTRGWKRLTAARSAGGPRRPLTSTSCEHPKAVAGFEATPTPRAQARTCSVRIPEIEVVRLQRQPQVEDLPLEVAAAVRAAVLPHLDQVRAGDTVAIGVGSRGIRDIPLVVAALITALQERAARPFIVPAMGSHGGADAAGQEETLRRLGVDSRLGAPVRATMDTVPVGPRR